MKTLKKMGNVEKGRLLADLLPEELPKIVHYIEQEIQYLLLNEQEIKNRWKTTLVTGDFYYRLVRNVENAIKQCGSRLHKNHRWFADQLFDGYDAIFTMYCLVNYAEKEECSQSLKHGIHFLFTTEKLILSDFNNPQP